MVLPPDVLQAILTHAEKTYPSECCGLVSKSRQGPENFQVFSVPNLQDEMHRRLPADFPRTAEKAYWMDPLELLRVQKILRRKDAVIAVIYHSHPDAAAVFSEEDERLAL